MLEQFNTFTWGFISGLIIALPLLKWLFGDEPLFPRILSWYREKNEQQESENYRLEYNIQGDNVQLRNIGKKDIMLVDLTYSTSRMPYQRHNPNLEGLDQLKKEIKELKPRIPPLEEISIPYVRGDVYFKIIYSDLDQKHIETIGWRTED